MQREAVIRAAKARGEVVDEWYADTLTGGTMRRPELDRLRVDARGGAVGKLYVWRLDRLGRSGIRDTLEVVDELRGHGVRLVTLADGFDVDGPAADIVIAVLAWAAKMERLAIRERLDEARARAMENGTQWGRPARMTRQQVRDARAMHECGKSIREIAVALKVPKSTVLRSLKPSRKWPEIPRTKGLRKAARRSR